MPILRFVRSWVSTVLAAAACAAMAASLFADPPDVKPKPDSGKSASRKSDKADGGAKASKAATEELAPFPEGPQEKKFLKKLGEGYQVRHTDHFFVMYSTDDKTVKEFITRIESTYKSVYRFAASMGIKVDLPKEKLPVVFCQEFEEYSSVANRLGGSPAPREAAGLYFPGANFSLFYDMANSDSVKEKMAEAKALQDAARNAKSAAERKQKSDEAHFIMTRMEQHQERSNRSVVRHEVAHQLLHNFNVHRRDVTNPVWFVEGMATLFEYEPGRGQRDSSGFNAINQYRLWRLRDADKAGPLPELTDLIRNPALLRGDGDTMDRGYAQAWGLVYYLSQHKKKQLQEFVELVKTRKPRTEITPDQELADFQKCFGPLDDTFKSKWAEFLKKIPYRPPR